MRPTCKGHLQWLTMIILSVLLVGACGSKKSLDLSTEEKGIRTLHQSLLDGDKETFRKCVSSVILEKTSARFDSWFEVWQRAAEKTPVEVWIKRPIKMVNEDGNWRLNEM